MEERKSQHVLSSSSVGTEWLQFEKTSKIVMSNHYPHAAKPTTKLFAQVPHLHIF